MAPHTDDLRIRRIEALNTPAEVIAELPCDDSVSEIVTNARQALQEILHGRDDRLAVVIGPCSIHDPKAAMDYARRLRPLRDALGLFLIHIWLLLLPLTRLRRMRKLNPRLR